MSEKLDKIAKKYGIKVKDINAENYVKGGLKFILMDDKEALKEVEKSIGADAIAEASKKETKKVAGLKGALGGAAGKTKPKANPGDAGGSTTGKVVKGVKSDKDPKVAKLAKGGDPSEFGMLSVKAGVDNNPKPTQADKIVGATKKMKKGGIVKKKPSRTRIAKRGFGIAKRGY